MVPLHTDRELPVGAALELSIDWPTLLHDVTPLQLIAAGQIVGTLGMDLTFRVTRHEFRTRGLAAGETDSEYMGPKTRYAPDSRLNLRSL